MPSSAARDQEQRAAGVEPGRAGGMISNRARGLLIEFASARRRARLIFGRQRRDALRLVLRAGTV